MGQHKEFCHMCEVGKPCSCSFGHDHNRRHKMACESCQSKLVSARCTGCMKPHFTVTPKEWCKPCKKELKKLQPIIERLDDNVQLIAISVDGPRGR